MDDYLPMFLAEAREHLQDLNLAVVRIEERPDDAETIDEIFRIAHSIKGMSAAMGFAGMAALTHRMEDHLELLRHDAAGMSREEIDVVLACLDALEGAVERIDSGQDEALDPERLVARLDALAAARAAAGGLRNAPDTDLSPPGAGGAAPADAPEPEPEPTEGASLRVTARLRDDAAMPAVRAHMVLAALAAHGTIVSSIPPADDVDGFAGREVVAFLATGDDAAAVESTACGVPDVAAAVVAEVDRAQAAEPVAGAPADGPSNGARPASSRKATATVRVDAERLDLLMHHMGEVVVHRTHVEALAARSPVPGLAQAVQDLTRSSKALQDMVMQIRLIPVEAVFLRFPRLVRDLSAKLSKQVELTLVGQDTELDRTVVDALGDPLVHLIRNSLDHGLEAPAEREAAGKPATGTLEIAARYAGGDVVITVRDDGRGIDPARVAARAAERGLIEPAAVAAIDMARAVELLFEPGFSTAEETSDISGRGVGMDAVRSAIRGLGGDVSIESEPGRGTATSVRLPLTLAIVAALLVQAGDREFAIPLDRIERTLRLEDHVVRSVAGTRAIVVDGAVLTLDPATERLISAPGTGAEEYAVVIRGGDGNAALAVDRLIGQHELVTRPLPPDVAEGSAVSGGAVLPDGSIALIVDCDAAAAVRAPATTVPQVPVP
jgi:two-component system chemotaxis sensor kinase CheA